MKGIKMNCYSCFHYDKNDYIHCYGTCELQGTDFRIDHECNIEEDRICYDSFHFGKVKDDSITSNSSIINGMMASYDDSNNDWDGF